MIGQSDSESFWDLSGAEKFAYLFNRTALGLGVMAGAYLAYYGNYLEAGIVFVFFIPMYFVLKRVFDAP